eukprot:CAMPEP_0181322672 /NCGR_PEP_ID=MMETSP1101-20121128/19353_1 /TAXON_ID=46948 /ORGANISM="Rhodomonas abbreviata, Strain Caron Lab Isolate" /LENGTH=374 /DNA_ID=CAMNT_0023430601 /DNA_START=54 /DNA_END=1178 /DNA_ORIENTATION=-
MVPSTPGSGPMSNLIATVKAACDEMAPMVRTFYEAVNGETSMLKADKSVFTIADGIVQHLVVKHLLAGSKFKSIVGEEDVEVNISVRPYTVDTLKVPDQFCDMIDGVRDRIDKLSAQVDVEAYKSKSVFVDPIDGTREFSTGLGEQCTILVGIAGADGLSEAGIIYRPVPNPSQWVAGCASEGCRMHNLQPSSEVFETPRLATTNGSISGWTSALLAAGMEQYKSGGCGNKAMLLLEGKASAYIQDRGISRWDSCGPEAVLCAFGGMLTKLSVVTQDPDAFASKTDFTSCRYTYLEADSNLDFVPNLATLTPYNARDGVAVDKTSRELAQTAEQVKRYANLCGLFAVSSAKEEDLKKYAALVKAATAASPPSFD